MLKKIMVINYFIVFLVLLVGAGLVIHYFVHENNPAVLFFIAFMIVDALFCFYLSLSIAAYAVKVEIDNEYLVINRSGEGGSEKIRLNDIIEYEIIGRRIAPKDILILWLADKRKIKLVCKLPWTSASDDFDTLTQYFRKRPQVAVDEQPSDLPTTE